MSTRGALRYFDKVVGRDSDADPASFGAEIWHALKQYDFMLYEAFKEVMFHNEGQTVGDEWTYSLRQNGVFPVLAISNYGKVVAFVDLFHNPQEPDWNKISEKATSL